MNLSIGERDLGFMSIRNHLLYQRKKIIKEIISQSCRTNLQDQGSTHLFFDIWLPFLHGLMWTFFYVCP